MSKADSKRFEQQYIEMAGLREKEQWRADKAEAQCNILLGLCEETLAKRPFPVGAVIFREKLQAVVEKVKVLSLEKIQRSE